MSKIRHLCLGVSALSLLIMAVFSMQADVFAYAGCRNPHEIVAGENLSMIAAQYNVTVGELIEENGIANPNMIAVGQVICIPNGAKKSSNSESVWNQPRYNDDWGDYGVPGDSYDPAWIGYEADSPSEYDSQAESNSPESYGTESNSIVTIYRGIPGQSYDPAQFADEAPSENSTNGNSCNSSREIP